MSNSLTTTFKVVATASIAVAIIFGGVFALSANKTEAALTEANIQAIISLLSSFGADAATVANVNASLRGQATTPPTTGGSASFTFTRNHKQGDTGGEVMNIQKFLNQWAETRVSASGAGSPGMETSTFGPATKAAVIKFQNMYAADILTPVGLSVGNGNWYAGTRAKANALASGTTTVPPVTTTPPPVGGTGGALTISSVAQPPNTLAPQSASRVPFTKFTLTNNSGVVTTVTGITVERTGLASDSVFTGVTLVDSNNVQIGTSKTFNTNHQAVVGDTFTINPGQSVTLTVAGNMAADLSSYAGQVVGITVVAVNANGSVSGSLPIMGASNTINSTLSLGSVSTTTSSYDPGAAQSKNLGDTAVRVSGLRFTAGSAEDLRLYSVRWRQVGTASSVDLANVVTMVGSDSYPTTISADGKYYTTVFPGGVLITKGSSIDLYNKVDLVGTNSASRTVDFDIDKVTDVYFVGQTYGFGVAPSGTYQPWFTGYVTTINPGTVTTIGKATEVPAQNIAVNVANQVLGGFVTDFKGEAVTVTSLPITIATSTGFTGNGPITSITIVDENGTVVAGPKDEATTCATGCTTTFTDTITFPTGRHIFTIKGKIPSGVSNNSTVTVTTVPSNWSGVTGSVSGNTITISTGSFDMNQMTVSAAQLNVSLSSTPGSQNVVGGGQGVLLANLELDATQSGEDVRISSLPIRFDVDTMTVGELTSCQIFDGASALNTGGNVVSTAADNTATTFTLDNTMTLTKGTVKTIAVKCNIASSVSTGDNVIVKIASGDTWNSTGVTSGTSITETFGNSTGGTMTIAAGALAVTTDPLSPAYTIAAAGSTGVTLGVAKFTATNEAVNLQRIGISLGDVTASSSAADLGTVSFWANNVQIATAQFAGTSRLATSTVISGVTIPKDGDLVVTIKGDLAAQGVGLPSHPGALLTVDVDMGGTYTKATGASSGVAITPTGSTSVAGVRVFRSYPTVARSTSGMSSTLIAQSGIDLYRFSISASAGGQGIALNTLTVNVATSSVSTTNGTTSVTNLKVYAYTGSDFSTGPVSGFTAGQIVATIAGLVSGGDNTATLSSVLTIPAGTTYYFKVVGDVAQVAGSTGSAGSVTTKLSGDTAYDPDTDLVDTTGNVTALFEWSPMSTSSTAATTNVDWTNGFNVAGISSGATDSWTLSK